MFGHERVLVINSVLTVIGVCWSRAEASIRRVIKTRHFDLDEEVISVLFFGELRHQLKKASDLGQVEEAFLQDLMRTFSFSRIASGYLRHYSQGLIAEVTMHPRYVEQTTGGDFGLSLVRPVVTDRGDFLEVEEDDCERGLICQAKVRRRDGHWGDLTPTQRTTLKDRTDYLAICLYDYADPERKKLKPFQWQVCKGTSIGDVTTWVRQDTFPSTIESTALITRLGTGQIGTSDPVALREVIHPEHQRGRIPSIVIRVTWRGDKPTRPLWIKQTVTSQTQQTVQARY